MKASDGGSKPLTAAQKAAARKRAAARKKTAAAQKFATNQLTAAGIKPKKPGQGVIKQFSTANKAAAAVRTKKKLGTIAGTGAGSSLTAGTKKGLPRPKVTAEQFATNQLTRAGVKVKKGGDVKAQFRAANKIAAQKRVKAGLDRARTVGAASSLTAGMRGPKRPKPLPPKKKPSAAKIKGQGGGT